MSQNTHQLLLFFGDPAQTQIAFDLLTQLEEEDVSEALGKAAVAALGDTFFNAWTEDWFNHELRFFEEDGTLLLQFDSSSHEGPCYKALQTLFRKGLKAAVLEIFHDQVGEISRYHFLDDMLVGMDVFSQDAPREFGVAIKVLPLRERDEDDTEDSDREDEDDLIAQGKRFSLSGLIKQEKKQEEDTQKMVDAMIGFSKLAVESGGDIKGTLQSVLVVRALIKGVLQALCFTIVTALLFKGIWLWIGLGVVLLIVLPLVYIQKELKSIEDIQGNPEDSKKEAINVN